MGIIKTFTWLVVFFILLVLTIMSASASEYNYSISQEFTHSLNPGDKAIGRLIFTPSIINDSSFNITNITNITTININIQDSICNQLNETVNIRNISLIPNGTCYQFNSVNNYVIESSWINYSIIVLSPPFKTIQLDSINSPFGIVFSKNSFPLSTVDQVYLNITLPDRLIPNSYYSFFRVNGVLYDFNFTVNSGVKWNYTEIYNKTILDMGTTGVMGELLVDNVGNGYTTISTIIEGNISDFIILPTRIISYSGDSVIIPITYNVKESQKSGNYSGTLKLFDDKQTEVRQLKIIVKDSILPKLDNDSISEKLESHREFFYQVFVSDNNNISEVILDIIGVNGSLFTKTFNNPPYKFEYTLNEGDYKFRTTITDSSGNKLFNDKPVIISKLNTIFWKSSVVAKKKRYDSDKQTTFITTDNRVDLTIKLLESNINFTNIKFITSNNDIRNIDVINGTITFIDLEPGNLSVVIKADLPKFFNNKTNAQEEKPSLDYSMFFQITASDYHISLGNSRVNGELINYTIPDPFKISWLSGTFSCEYRNVDDYEEARSVCTTDIPGLWSKGDFAAPMTFQDRNNLETTWKTLVNNLQMKNFAKILYITILLFLFFLMLWLYFYVSYIKPYVMLFYTMKRKKTGDV